MADSHSKPDGAQQGNELPEPSIKPDTVARINDVTESSDLVHGHVHAVRYERGDADIKGLYYFMGALVGIMLFCMLLMYWNLHYFINSYNMAQPKEVLLEKPPEALSSNVVPQTYPRLEGFDDSTHGLRLTAGRTQKMIDEWTKELNTPGWVDESKGIARPSISQAMDWVAQQWAKAKETPPPVSTETPAATGGHKEPQL